MHQNQNDPTHFEYCQKVTVEEDIFFVLWTEGGTVGWDIGPSHRG